MRPRANAWAPVRALLIERRPKQPFDQRPADPPADRNGDVEEEAGQGRGVEGPLANRLDAFLQGHPAREPPARFSGVRSTPGDQLAVATDLIAELGERLSLAGPDLAAEPTDRQKEGGNG